MKLLTIRLKSIQSMVDVIIAIFNANPENFKPEFFPPVQIYNFLTYFTWTLRIFNEELVPVSYTHLRAHETRSNLVCRLLLEKKKQLFFTLCCILSLILRVRREFWEQKFDFIFLFSIDFARSDCESRYLSSLIVFYNRFCKRATPKQIS